MLGCQLRQSPCVLFRFVCRSGLVTQRPCCVLMGDTAGAAHTGLKACYYFSSFFFERTALDECVSIDIGEKYKITVLKGHRQETKRKENNKLARLNWDVNTGYRSTILTGRLDRLNSIHNDDRGEKAQPQLPPTIALLRLSKHLKCSSIDRGAEGADTTTPGGHCRAGPNAAVLLHPNRPPTAWVQQHCGVGSCTAVLLHPNRPPTA